MEKDAPRLEDYGTVDERSMRRRGVFGRPCGKMCL